MRRFLLPVLFVIVGPSVLFFPATVQAEPAGVTFVQSSVVVDSCGRLEVVLNIDRPDAANPFTDVPGCGGWLTDRGDDTMVMFVGCGHKVAFFTSLP